MKPKHVERILAVFRSVATIPLATESVIRQRLTALNLEPGPEPYLGQKRDKRSLWLNKAREWARVKALSDGKVSTQDILEEIPPPTGVDIRAVGGVFKSKEWKRIGDIRVKGDDGRYKFVGEFTLVESEQKKNEASPKGKHRGPVTEW